MRDCIKIRYKVECNVNHAKKKTDVHQSFFSFSQCQCHCFLNFTLCRSNPAIYAGYQLLDANGLSLRDFVFSMN